MLFNYASGCIYENTMPTTFMAVQHFVLSFLTHRNFDLCTANCCYIVHLLWKYNLKPIDETWGLWRILTYSYFLGLVYDISYHSTSMELNIDLSAWETFKCPVQFDVLLHVWCQCLTWLLFWSVPVSCIGDHRLLLSSSFESLLIYLNLFLYGLCLERLSSVRCGAKLANLIRRRLLSIL